MSDETCPVCKNRRLWTPEERGLSLCTACAASLAVKPMPAPRRPTVPCVKCNGLSFVRAVPREIAPMLGHETHQVTSSVTVTFGGKRGDDGQVNADPRRRFGQLEMYICKGCGFVEWYCTDPERIPIGPHFMTELVEYGAPPTTPFR
ncbi:MAG: hypothetical protein H0X17_24235 [Deltaproteobacteria bacterium]|nr:hypothetical protein [Deltaproteobacteria bacterium]